MREAFSESLARAAEANPRLRLLTGDHGYALFDRLRKTRPGQFINAGVAEQNMIGVAAGLAKTGFFPVVYGLSAFVPVRVLEQIKLDLCYEGLPALLVGDGAGVVYSSLGSSHQSTEDMAALRALPGIEILSPADEHEMREAFAYALTAGKPVYLRMGKADLGSCHSGPPGLRPGELLRVRDGSSEAGVAFIATGSMVHLALELAKTDFPAAAVWSAPFVKPLLDERVHPVLDRYRAVVVLEEHSIYGGLGGAIAEIAAERAKTRVYRVGITDRFSQYCGTYTYLMKEHALDRRSVAEKIRSWSL